MIAYPGFNDSNKPPLIGFAGEEARLYRKKVYACQIEISPEKITERFNNVNLDLDKNPTAEYLRYFHEHVKSYIAKHHTPPFVLTSRARYCFTLQYKNEEYKEHLQKALKLSGIIGESDRDDKAIFVDKYIAISSYIMETNNDLRTSDEFLICDAGDLFLTIKRMKISEGEAHKNIVEIQPERSINRILLTSLDESFQSFITPKINEMAKDMDPAITYDISNAIQVASLSFSKNEKVLQNKITVKHILIFCFRNHLNMMILVNTT